MDIYSQKTTTVSYAVIAIVAALGLLGLVLITVVVVVTIPLQQEAAGCPHPPTTVPASNASIGRCLR
jgi:hypothetical protein